MFEAFCEEYGDYLYPFTSGYFERKNEDHRFFWRGGGGGGERGELNRLSCSLLNNKIFTQNQFTHFYLFARKDKS